MIQDISPHCFDNAYRPIPPDSESVALYYENNLSLVKNSSQGIAFPKFKDLQRLNEDIYEDYIYLFAIDDTRYYLVREVNLERISAFQMENTEIFRLALPMYTAFAGITGYQLYNWYKKRRYCGCCGEPLQQDEKERMLFCKGCGQVEYPRINPAVIIGVCNENRILLSKYANRPLSRYALLAGFVEIGEPLEDAVKREVLEEVGLHVTNVRYYKSQPWSYSDTLLMGFYCDVVDKEEEICLDEKELAFAGWFEREEIPVKPRKDSLTNEMIIAFKEARV
ncbi:MAG: NAD(+) diphosphatase [Lachnospiraceae bacterium]|nr:NAD(+) diphosphatase [Lachnospiraceae bacterium]